MMKSAGKRGCCTDAGYVWKSGNCYEVDSDGKVGTTIKTDDVWDDSNGTCKNNTSN